MENERYPYWPLPERPIIRWPNNARVAFWIIPNVEHFRFDLLSFDVEQRDLLPDAADQARVGDGRADAAGADDGDLAGGFRHSAPLYGPAPGPGKGKSAEFR